MGYETLEKDSLITLKVVLDRYIESVKNKIQRTHSQRYSDAKYELDRINSELNIRY